MKHDRMSRVNRLMQMALAEMVPALVRDPRVGRATMVSVMEVRTTPDLRHARVYVSILGGSERQRAGALDALNAASAFLRGELGRRVKLRYTPELAFTLDTTLDRAEQIEGILRELSDSDDGDDSDNEQQ